MTTAGQALARLRRGQNPPLSQARLGRLVSHSATHINLIEHGRRGLSRDLAIQIARALHLPPTAEREFLAAVGFPAPPVTEPLNDLVRAIMAADPDNLIIAEFARADLLLHISSWRSLVQAQSDLRAGGYDDILDNIERLRRDPAVSPMIHLYATRKLAEASRVARDLADADDLLRNALDSGSEDLKTLAAVAPYHGALMRIVLLSQRGEVALQQGAYRAAYDLFKACDCRYRALPEIPSSVGWPEINEAETGPRVSRPNDPSGAHGSYPMIVAVDPNEARTIVEQGLGLTALRLAETLMYLERTDEALNKCAEAKGHLNGIRDTTQKVLALRRATELEAWARARAHEYDAAAARHMEARDEARKAHDADAEMINWLYLGDDRLHQIEDMVEAISQEAATRQPPQFLSPGEAWKEALRQDSRRATWLEEAEKAFQEARSFQEAGERRKHPYAHSVSHCLRGLATIARLNQEYSRATDLLLRAETREQARRSKRRLRFIFEERGDLHWDQGFLELASREYLRALQAAEKDIEQIRASQPKGEERSAKVGAVLEALRARLARKIARLNEAARQEALSTSDDQLATPSALLAESAPAAPGLSQAHPHRAARDAHDTLDRLCRLAIQVIRANVRVPAAHDVDSDIWLDSWLQDMNDFEHQPGARLLAQNEFSLSLSPSLPRHMRTNGAFRPLQADGGAESDGDPRGQLFASRHAAFVESVHRAHSGRVGSQSNLDICSQPWVSEYATDEEVATRAREALKLRRERRYGYAIAAASFRFPFAFGVKGDHTLIEAPEGFLHAARLLRSAGAESASDPARGAMSDERHERRAGFRFTERDIAEEFRRLFIELYQAILRETDMDQTLRWLRDIAYRGERKPPSFM